MQAYKVGQVRLTYGTFPSVAPKVIAPQQETALTDQAQAPRRPNKAIGETAPQAVLAGATADAWWTAIYKATVHVPADGAMSFELTNVPPGAKLVVSNYQDVNEETFAAVNGTIRVAMRNMRPGDKVTMKSQGLSPAIDFTTTLPDERGESRNLSVYKWGRQSGLNRAEARFAVDTLGSATSREDLRFLRDSDLMSRALRGAQVARALRQSLGVSAYASDIPGLQESMTEEQFAAFHAGFCVGDDYQGPYDSAQGEYVRIVAIDGDKARVTLGSDFEAVVSRKALIESRQIG